MHNKVISSALVASYTKIMSTTKNSYGFVTGPHWKYENTELFKLHIYYSRMKQSYMRVTIGSNISLNWDTVLQYVGSILITGKFLLWPFVQDDLLAVSDITFLGPISYSVKVTDFSFSLVYSSISFLDVIFRYCS